VPRLLKALPPRATRQSDSAALANATKSKVVTPTVKGGKGIYDRIATISAVVTTKLGKYADEYLLLRTDEAVFDYFEHIKRAGKAAIDTETDSLNAISCNLAGICLYTPGQKPAYIPMHHVSYVTGVESSNQISDDVVRQCLQSCNASNVRWVMHNAKFDIRVLRNQLGIEIPCMWDTRIAAALLNENESASLKDLHLKYCKSKDDESLTYEKLFQDIPFTHVPISIGYLYAAGDPVKTWEVMQFQQKYLNPQKLPGPYYVFSEIEMPLIPVVADMEDRGIGFDKQFARELSVKYNEQLKRKEQKFYEALNIYANELSAYKSSHPNHKLSDPVNIGSPLQIAIILYDVLGLKSPDKEKPRGTGEDILVTLDSPLVKALLEYREITKLLSTYIDKMPTMLNSKTNRIHCSFNQCGAATGRFSSSDPNMQNIPSQNKEIRKMFCASEGYVLICCDFSQQEPRTLAHMSQDERLIQAYRDERDIYSWVAAKIYNVPYEECSEVRADGTKNPEGKKRRTSVKSIILGIMYGRGAKAISEQLGCSVKEAQKIVDQFFTTFPKVRKWMDTVVTDAKKNGFVETAWGRKRRLPDVQLPPYEFTLMAGGPSTFDPLDFGSAHNTVAEVSPKVKQQYISRLEKTWSGHEKRAIIQEAHDKGVKIKDNGGLIADAERQCVNSIIQGSSADMTKKAMIAIRNDTRLRELDCHLLLQVHDEIIVECPEQHAKECSAYLVQLMVDAAAERIVVPMKCVPEIMYSWYGETVEV